MNSLIKKILFVGDLNDYCRSYQRFRALIDLEHQVFGLSHTPIPYRPGIDSKPNLLSRIMWKLSLPLDLTGVNKEIREAIKKERFDIVWIDKGLTIRPQTLTFIKNTIPSSKIVSCSEDDMYAKHNQSHYYLRGLPYYDIIFTTKIYNLTELKLLGAKRTELFLDAYDEKLHQPVELTEEEKQRFGADVGFIGGFEEDRAEKMLYLAKRGIKIVVWGSGWKNWIGKHPNLIVKNHPLYYENYAKAICATKINLCFLRKINRDEITSRSVEIPACGGFMLAERTTKHLELFEDGKEAVFFSSNEELYDLVKKYLVCEKEREIIAKAGREKILKSGREHKEQLKKMLSIIENL